MTKAVIITIGILLLVARVAPLQAQPTPAKLAEEEINLRLISTSPIKVTCLIPRAEVERAVRALHTAFSLGAE